jgi:hypoxanthine phosphoribosyltransferase
MEMDRPEDRHEIISWAEVDQLIDLLIPQINSVGVFTSMIMITRGGLIPGGMLAEALNIQHVLTAAVDFPAKATGAASLMVWPKFLQFPEPSLVVNRRTLIVDDVWGSGRTSVAVRERVATSGATPFTCVMHYNPNRSLFTDEKPDFYGAVTDAYIVYPWEMDRGVQGFDMQVPSMN